MTAHRRTLAFLLLPAATALWASGCSRVPLLAPSGSTIALTTAVSALPVNGTADIVAQVIEASGTPPQKGTHITFLTTLGSVQPSETETDINGRVLVKFFAGNANGTATITASSGGASTGATGSVKIAIGTAAVGRISLNANPSVISSNGGSSTITANVVDINGNALSAAPVSFSTSAGSLKNSIVTTDLNGIAETTLTTTVQATVTATVGVQGSNGGTTPGTPTTPETGTGGSTSGQASATVTVNVSPLPTVSIAPPSGTLTAGSPVVFTYTVTPGTNSTAQIRDVRIDFGDGDVRDLGAVTGQNLIVQHVYDNPDTYTVRLTATDTLGGTTSAATVIVVLAQPPLSVTISASSSISGPNTLFTFTATVTPSSATVSSYLWDFGDGGSPQLTTGPQVTHSYLTGSGAKSVSVEVTTTTGQMASTSIIVSP